MKGTNEELGRKILADSGLPIIAADNMADAAQKIVAAAEARRKRMEDQSHVDSDQRATPR
mgnify:CR=1 FL=1